MGLSPTFQGIQHLRKVARDEQANALQLEKELDAVQARCDRHEKTLDDIFNFAATSRDMDVYTLRKIMAQIMHRARRS